MNEMAVTATEVANNAQGAAAAAREADEATLDSTLCRQWHHSSDWPPFSAYR